MRRPASAARSAVAAATVVLPTPPLPVIRSIRDARAGVAPLRSRLLDLLLQLAQGGAHDHPCGAPLDETGERRREVDGELVVHLGRRRPRARSGTNRRAAGACRPRRASTTATPAPWSSRTAGCSGSSCRAPRPGTRPGSPALVVAAHDRRLLHVARPLRVLLEVDRRPRSTAAGVAATLIRSFACSATRSPFSCRLARPRSGPPWIGRVGARWTLGPGTFRAERPTDRQGREGA